MEIVFKRNFFGKATFLKSLQKFAVEHKKYKAKMDYILFYLIINCSLDGNCLQKKLFW